MIGKIIALDWRATIRLHKLAFLMYPFFAFIVGTTLSQMLMLPFCAWMALVYSTNSFYAEEKGELNNLYQTLPVKRSQIVFARYVYSLKILVAVIAMGLIIMPVARHFSSSRWYLGIRGNVALVAVSVLIYAILNIMTFPPFFKLNYHKGKIVSLYVVTAVFFVSVISYYLFMLLSENNITFDFIVFASENMLLVSGGIMASAAMIILLSYRLSIRFYTQREL